MDKIELERKIAQMSDTDFQRLIDYLLQEEGINIISYGNCDGKKRTRKGTPDSYFKDESKCEMTFVEYTVQASGLEKKIINDIKSCFKKAKTFKKFRLSKILYYVNSNNIPPEVIDSAVELCNSKKVDFQLFSLSYICKKVYEHKSVTYEFFKESIDGAHLETLDEFINLTKKLQGIDHSINYVSRIEESKVKSSLKENFITIVSGKSGVGKSMLTTHVLKEIGGNIFCISHNNEDALDYFKDKNIVEENMIIFFDDVNEIKPFNEFLFSLSEEIIKKIKIICTIRDYAQDSIIKIIEKYKFKIGIVTLDSLDKKGISDIVKQNLPSITNNDLNKIISVSKGIPRLCMMACTIRKEGGSEIFNETKDIYKVFFKIALGSEIKRLIDESINFLALVAFLKGIDIRHVNNYKEILDFFNVDTKNLREVIKELNKYELCCLYENSLVEIKDQNLSDYFIDRVVIDERPFKLSELISRFIAKFPDEMQYMIRTIYNVYTSDKSKEYIINEINECFDLLKCSHNYDILIKNFYDFNIDKTFLYIEKTISTLYPFYKGDQCVFSKAIIQNDYVNILKDIFIKHHNEKALLLLIGCLEFENIRNNAYDAIIQISCLTLDNISNRLLDGCEISLLKSYNSKPRFNIIRLEIISNKLKYTYRSYNTSSMNGISVESFEINDSIINVKEYRNKQWSEAHLLSDEYKYKLIFEFKDFYLKDNNIETFSNDLINIGNLIKSINEVDVQYTNEQFFKAILIYKYQSKININDLLYIHNGSEIQIIVFYFQIWQLVKRNYKLHKDILSKVSLEILYSLLQIYSKIDDCFDSYKSIIYILSIMIIHSMDTNIIMEILKGSKMQDLPIGVRKCVLSQNYNRNNKEDVFNYLFGDMTKEKDIDEYFEFFDILLEKDINKSIKRRFCILFESDIKINKIANREIKTLYKFATCKREFVKDVCKLYSNKDKSELKVISWLKHLFNNDAFTSMELISMFSKYKKIKVLEDIFMFLLNKDDNAYIDDLNNIVYDLMLLDKEFAQNLIFQFFSLKNILKVDLFSNLWEQTNCNNLANYIFDLIGKVKEENAFTELRLEEIFLEIGGGCKDMFIQWAKEKTSFINDDNSMFLMSLLISKLDFDETKFFYEKLINFSYNFNLFKKILMCPHVVSISGSEVNYYLYEIKRIKNIRGLIPDKHEYNEYITFLNKYISNLEDNLLDSKIKRKMRQ